ncbi:MULTISPECIES: hypothetical protein [unclassified Crossiella]|uniref:hypothetical protein n=1 Tax=unclassified Crossiella TaxID=2620835 RepID=UPI001FFF7792|nr:MULTISPECIES: hypothetical protein [unclassified Crossiella]MCK2238960.1 hypothetical protein [Crossiella sp. S99.2]MCK2251470.1 hypothetical protein [Crossiella sp. S99.1]
MPETKVEDVVQRLSRRPGYRLITYREVAIPHWDVPLQCRVLARKPLPPLDEFSLRSIEAGLHTSDEVTRFLGVPANVVEATLGKLLSHGHIAPTPVASDTSVLKYFTTESGKKLLRDMSEISIQDKTINIPYDGLTNQYKIVDNTLRWRPRDLRDENVLEIPAFPADPPEVYASDTAAIAGAIKEITNKIDIEVITVTGVDGRRSRFFVRGIALVFQSVDSPNEFQVRFAIDGRPSEEHDLAFARAEGMRKLGITDALKQSAMAAEKVLSQDLLSQRLDETQVSSLRRTTELLKAQLNTLEEKGAVATEPDSDAGEMLTDEVADLASRLDDAQAALERAPVRILEVHEHPSVLEDALGTARNRLLIISPWIRAAVVDDAFVRSVRILLESGVQVSIGYGIDDGKGAFDRDRAAEGKLQQLSENFENFHFARLGDTHAKVLVVDDRHAVVTSFNWLSFRGHPNRPFRDERGTLVTVGREIERLYTDYLGRIRVATAVGTIS